MAEAAAGIQKTAAGSCASSAPAAALDAATLGLLDEAVAALYPDMVAFAQRLLQTPSLSGEEGALARLCADEMRRLGYDDVFIDAIGNAVGIVRGSEPGPTILYNSHMDAVSPGDPANWQGYDPFGGALDICDAETADRRPERAECVHGRGASDVKGGEAVHVYAGGALARLRAGGVRFPGTFVFTGVVQEEQGQMIGMKHLADTTLAERGIFYDAMVSSEATSLKLMCGHKGRIELLVTVYGRTSHASAPDNGINAVYKALPLIQSIRDSLAPNLRTDPDLGQATIALTIISCSPGALSVVPDRCQIALDRRTVPGETTASVLAEIQAIIDALAAADPEFRADVAVRSTTETSWTGLAVEAEKNMGPWKISPQHAFVRSAAAALEAIGQPAGCAYWRFTTDASKSCAIDRKPTIGYSPMQEQYAHTPFDRCRTDFMKIALAGSTAIFLNAAAQGPDAYEPVEQPAVS